MQGKILAFDFRSSEGVISGNDGLRYSFAGNDWKQESEPKAGSTVDFEIDGSRALSIYVLSSPSPLSGEKNRIIAALFAFFLGGFGAHKFYLGKPGPGIAMLLWSLLGAIAFFIPTLIIGLIAFIEFIIYLSTSDEDFRVRYVDGKRSWF